jgi:acyl carrier protein
MEFRLRMGMDIVELVTGLEERFGVVIGNEEVSQITTVGSLVTAICAARASKGLEEIRWSDVYAVMVDILQSDYGIGGHLLRPEARLVEDLGLD